MRLTELALRRAGAADLEEFQRREGLYPSGQEDILTMQRLTPLLLGYERYMVKPGDTYYRIATARGTSVRAMLTANPNQNPNLLIPGQYLNVPYGFPVVPTDVPFSSELLQICVQGLLVRYPFLSQKCIARTAWGRPVTALRIGQGPRCALYNASHHANEWITTPVLLLFLEQYAYAVATEGRILGMDAQQLWRRTTLWLVPMVNPDGVDLVTGAIRPGSQQYQAAQRIAAGFPEIPFPGGWKANLTGTDLNLNYPAGWEQARTNKFALGFTGPSGLCRGLAARPAGDGGHGSADSGHPAGRHAVLSHAGRRDLLALSGLCAARCAGARRAAGAGQRLPAGEHAVRLGLCGL